MRTVLVRAALALALVPAPASAQSLDVPVRLMLFGDATFMETERAIADGFSLGQVVGHMNATLAPKLLVFVEGTLTPTAGPPTPTLERLIIRYDYRDWLKLSAGRYHTPVSWWNTAYHHGSWLQTSVARPRMVRYGTPLVPIHFNGVLAEGVLHTGPLVFGYELGAGNGRQTNPALPGDAGDDDNSLALVGGLRFRSLAIPGAEVGLHAYVDEYEGVGFTPVSDERILSAHVALQRELEVIGEYMLIRHTPSTGLADGDDFNSTAWYAHLGYRLPPSLLGLRPYVRFEKIASPLTDPVFGPGLDYEAWIGGIRWDFSDFAALKFEYRDEEPEGGDDGQSLLVNASFVIPNLLGGGGQPAGH